MIGPGTPPEDGAGVIDPGPPAGGALRGGNGDGLVPPEPPLVGPPVVAVVVGFFALAPHSFPMHTSLQLPEALQLVAIPVLLTTQLNAPEVSVVMDPPLIKQSRETLVFVAT